MLILSTVLFLMCRHKSPHDYSHVVVPDHIPFSSIRFWPLVRIWIKCGDQMKERERRSEKWQKEKVINYGKREAELNTNSESASRQQKGEHSWTLAEGWNSVGNRNVTKGENEWCSSFLQNKCCWRWWRVIMRFRTTPTTNDSWAIICAREDFTCDSLQQTLAEYDHDANLLDLHGLSCFPIVQSWVQGNGQVDSRAYDVRTSMLSVMDLMNYSCSKG